MTRKVIITGFNGFVGRHACRELRERGYEIHGITERDPDEESRGNVDRVTLCDLSDAKQTSRLEIGDCDAVLNLAGYATNVDGDPARVHRVNIGAHVNLYERIHALGLSPRIIAVSTGLVYDPTQSMPVGETGNIRDPETARPYEASKVLMERALQEYKTRGMQIVTARPFNHTGPGQRGKFIVSEFADQIEMYIATGKPIETGNLHTLRDYSDVGDIVSWYADLVEADKPAYDVYNLCSGTPTSGAEVLALLCGEYGVANPEQLETASKTRPGEILEFYGDNSRILSEFGQRPTTKLAQTIHNYVVWRKTL